MEPVVPTGAEPPVEADINVHPSNLKETPPEFMSYLARWFVSSIEQNGWYILGGGLVLLYVWSKVNPILIKWLEERADREFQAKLHKDPDAFRMRQEAQEVARLRMQQEHDARARLEEEKRKEREARKREEWLAHQGVNVARAGHRLSDNSPTHESSGTQKPKTSGFRSEYNPLGGSGGSSGFRPQRRSCPGGGCG